MAILPPFLRLKKIEKFLNTPLRISAGCDIICGVDSARGRNGHRPLNCGKASPYGARGQLGNTTRYRGTYVLCTCHNGARGIWPAE